ncbi:MAG: hypothetical protein AB8G17_04040 [Gammaproteobacteria bacterium]
MKLLVGTLTVLYPALVYFGLAHLRPGVFAALLAALVLLRPTGLSSAERKRALFPMAIILSYAALVAVLDSATLLRFYPVLMNALMLAVFSYSLLSDAPIIERIARARGMPIPPQAKAYLRGVTQVWCGFFVLNALMAAYTALYSSWEFWTLYNGLIAYVLVGALMGGELVFRHFYKRRVAEQADA